MSDTPKDYRLSAPSQADAPAAIASQLDRIEEKLDKILELLKRK